MKISPEHVSISNKNPFKVQIFTELGAHPMHYHKQSYEIAITYGCTGTRIIGDHIGQMEDADMVLTGPGLPHCWYHHTINATTQKVVVIQFIEDMFPKSAEADYLQFITTARRRAKLGVILTGADRLLGLSYVEKLGETDDLKNYLTILQLLNLFGGENAQTLCSEGYAFEANQEADKELELELNYTAERFRNRLRLEEVAELVHLSPTAFSHYFKKRTLMSFTDFVLGLRLGKSAQMLQFSDHPVTQIAFDSGFNNLSNFNRLFKRKYGLKPLEFRQKAEKLAANSL